MKRRKKIEQQWLVNSQKMNQYMEQLSKWKQSVTKQLEQQKAKGYDLMTELQHSISLEVEELRKELKEKDELLKQKDSIIQEKETELKWKREDVKRLTQMLTSHSAASTSSPNILSTANLASERPTLESTGSSFFGNAANVDVSSLPIEEDSYSFCDHRVSWLDSKTRADHVIDLLFRGQFTIIETILEHSIRIPDECLSALLHIAESRNETMRFFKFAIQYEVESTKIETTLFRGNTITTKLMTMYTSLYGVPFLSEILQPLLQGIIDESVSHEIDPNRNQNNEDLVANMAKLTALVQTFVDRILEHSKNLPEQFKHICVMITQEITKKFPEDKTAGVKNFLFLRYICPAILAPPKEFGLEEIKETPRRTMVLISKILQNCVNGVELKEPFMLVLNEFVSKNAERIKQFMTEVGKPSEENAIFLPLKPKTSGGDYTSALLSGLSSVRETLSEKLRLGVDVPISVNLNYKISTRYTLVCSLWGPYKKGQKVSISLSESRTNELISLLLEEDQFLVDLVKVLVQEKDVDRMINILDYVIMNKSPKTFLKLIQHFLRTDVLGSGSPEIASRKLFAQLSVFVAQEFIKNAFGSLLDDLAVMQEELKPNTEQLYDYCYRVIVMTVKYLSFIPQPLGSILRYLHQNLLDRFGQNVILVTMETMDFYLSIVCEALQNPELFNLHPKTAVSEAGRKRMRKSMTTLSEAIPKFLKASDEVPIEFRKQTRSEDPKSLFVEWVNGTEEGTSGLVYSNKLTLKEALRSLYTIINDKSQTLLVKMSDQTTSRSVEFNLADFLDCLLARRDK
eukprot:TRINITY_DN3638_c0_g1_i2.p1 TRINITY_DN3638_c0_g1~~TRINITY_DN3638_c0_g1_i2.p1  ORF type:complete len:799 (-),score=319.23 TRINITY_DN3638_c0_g1_i2:104-2500(-)